MRFDFVEPLVFALLSLGVIVGGAAVVLIDRITAAALFMAFTFLCMAGMFVLLGAETIAAFQVLIYVGADLLTRALWPLVLLPAVLFLMRRRVIALEEAYLERKFTDDYRAYRARVRRWL